MGSAGFAVQAVAMGLGNSSLALKIDQQQEEMRQREMLRTMVETNAVFAKVWQDASLTQAQWAAAGFGPGGTLVTAPAPEPEPRDAQPKLILEEPKATEPIVRQFPELDFSEQPEKPSP